MTGYVIVRQDGSYLAPLGLEHCWTRDLAKAAVFRSREDANHEVCPDNESVRSLASILTAARERRTPVIRPADPFGEPTLA